MLQLEPALVTPARRPALSISVAPATRRHIPAITAIYRDQIEGGVGSWEHPLPDNAEMARRLADLRTRGLPAVVALDGSGQVQGFSWANPFRAKAHYRHTVEDSIHVYRGARRRGVGEALLTRLVKDCTARGFRQMIAVIGDARNTASIALHEKLGFTPVAFFPGIGNREGEWCDTVMLQRALATEPDRAS